MGIIKGTENVSLLEIGLSIKNTLEQPLIRSVFKGENGQTGFSVVRVLVKRFVDSFGFSTKLSEVQIDTITVDTLTKFEYESLQDILLFFKMARSGSFGATSKGVDSNLIFGDWFPKYLELKSIEREAIITSKKEQELYPDQENAVSLFYCKQREKKKKEEQHNKQLSEIDEMVKNMDRQMLEDTILDWSKKEEMLPYLDYLKRKRLTIK